MAIAGKKENRLERSLYIVGEVQEPEIRRLSSSRWVSLLVTVVAILLFIMGIVVYLFSAAIMIFNGLREAFWNWGFISLGQAVLLFMASRFLRNRLGFAELLNYYNRFEINYFLGKNLKIKKTEIYAVSVRTARPLKGLVGSYQQAVITTYDKTYTIWLDRYRNTEELVVYFNDLSEILRDEYYEIIQQTSIRSFSILRRVWNTASGKIGIFILVIYIFFGTWGLFSMLLYPSGGFYANSFYLRNPEISNSFLEGYNSRSIVYHPPNEDFLFGTDYVGRDIFARLVYGTVHAFGVSLLAATIFLVLAVIFGYSTAFIGGWWDTVISRVADTLLTFPPIIPIIIIATFSSGLRYSFLEQYYYLVFSILALLTWPQGMKLIKTETRKLLDQEYIAAARMLGASNWHLIFRHVIPKTRPTLVLLFVYTISEVIMAMTMIGLIGLGLGTNLTWGSDLERAIVFTDIPVIDRWWTVLYPSLWLAGIIIGLTLLSDSVRDQFQLSKESGGKL